MYYMIFGQFKTNGNFSDYKLPKFIILGVETLVLPFSEENESTALRIKMVFNHQTSCYKSTLQNRMENKSYSPVLHLIIYLSKSFTGQKTSPYALKIKVGKNVKREFEKHIKNSQFDEPTSKMRRNGARKRSLRNQARTDAYVTKSKFKIMSK